LSELGKTAPANIIESKQGRITWTTGHSGVSNAAGGLGSLTVKVQVRPDGEPPFDATVKYSSDEQVLLRQHRVWFKVGETIPVCYDPNDHTKVIGVLPADEKSP